MVQVGPCIPVGNWEHSEKMLKSAQLLGQLGVSLTSAPQGHTYREVMGQAGLLVGDGALALATNQVRKTSSRPRSWANFDLFYLYSHRNARANWHILGQPNTFIAPVRRARLGLTAVRRHSPPSRCAGQCGASACRLVPSTVYDKLLVWYCMALFVSATDSLPRPAVEALGNQYTSHTRVRNSSRCFLRCTYTYRVCSGCRIRFQAVSSFRHESRSQGGEITHIIQCEWWFRDVSGCFRTFRGRRLMVMAPGVGFPGPRGAK
jgi:hypothetical protein